MSHKVNSVQLFILISLFCITVLAHATLPTSADINQIHKSSKTPEGISTHDWNSIQTQIREGKYKAYSENEGYQSSNPAHGWQIHYAADGTTTLSPRDHDMPAYHLGMKLSAIGYNKLKTLRQPQAISSENNTVDYHWNDTLIERWINSETNLEQWFLLSKRPEENTSGRFLTLKLTFASDLSAVQQGNNIRFSRASDNTTITYSKLKVWDATGRQIPAKIQLAKQQLSLLIDERTARYPLTIDPSFQQQAYLKASNTESDDNFGVAVAISGDTLVIGADNEFSNAKGVNGDQSNNSSPESGAAYVFVRRGNSWIQQAYLKASNASSYELFGCSVAISGNTIVIAAHDESSNATGINGDQNNSLAFRSGAAYVFTRNGNTWSQQAYLKASNTERDDRFGLSVAISGDTVVVGAFDEDSSATGIDGDQNDNSVDGSGAAYVFTRSGNTWSQQAYLKASNTEANDNFGDSVAISNNTIVVSAGGESSNATGVNGNQSNNSVSGAGAAYVFTRNGNVWSQQAYLKASNTPDGSIFNRRGDSFANSIAISGNTVVVGAWTEDSNATGVNGDQDNNLAAGSGAAYVFIRQGTTWRQQAYLKASSKVSGGNVFEFFGSAVAVSDNTIVVGTDPDNFTVNDETDLIDNNSGSVYVFKRQGNEWRQQDLLKASNSTEYDNFGTAVAVSGNTVLVGAWGEDSNATGVNGEQDDSSEANAGAAYVYTASPQQPNATVAREGLWWIPSQSGSGFDIGINSNNDMFMVWYTYRLDGRPIWYLASAPLNGSEWNADLLEFTWNGNTANSKRVGGAQINFQDASHATLSWTLDTGNGSTDIEYFVFDQGSSVNAGTWFDPGQPGYGLTQVNQGATQVKVLYFYDQSGNPVWALGSGAATTATTQMDSFAGTCPACSHENSSASPAGTVTTSFAGQTNGILSTDINLLSPLSGNWQIFDATISNLSE